MNAQKLNPKHMRFLYKFSQSKVFIHWSLSKKIALFYKRGNLVISKIPNYEISIKKFTFFSSYNEKLISASLFIYVEAKKKCYSYQDFLAQIG